MRALALLVIMVLLAGCASQQRSDERMFRSAEHTVRSGETLYSIAWRYGLQWQQLAEWNGIRAPYTIYPGQRLRMNPPSGTRTASTSPATSPAPATRPSASPPASPAASTSRQPASSAPAAAPVPIPASNLRWQWPTEGAVVKTFPTEGTARRGIGIAGRMGQPVFAAAPGRVVYSGSGLVGYGRLIIIKHDERFVSAYAHNEKILVNEGDEVRAGQRIALLGDTGTDSPMLHFEIRVDGRPVDPLRLLPPR